jgi:hypothetical protein
MLKNVIYLIAVLLFPLALSAQDEISTIHIKAPPDQKNGISFSVHCDNTDTIFKEIFMSGTDNFLFYWGNMNSPTSVSFKEDSNSVHLVKSLLTTDLLYTLEHNSDSVEDFRLPCAYTITTIKDGVVKSYDALPAGEIKNNIVGYDKLRRLARVLQKLYDKYHFPK